MADQRKVLRRLALVGVALKTSRAGYLTSSPAANDTIATLTPIQNIYSFHPQISYEFFTASLCTPLYIPT
jgi:hypothetical protein